MTQARCVLIRDRWMTTRAQFANDRETGTGRAEGSADTLNKKRNS